MGLQDGRVGERSGTRVTRPSNFLRNEAIPDLSDLCVFVVSPGNVFRPRYSPNGLFPNEQQFAKDASEEINTNQQYHEGNIIFVG